MLHSCNETQQIRLLLLLADTQAWLNELCSEALHNIQPGAKKLFSARSYRLSITAFAHIIERHYHKTLRHPGTGKFNIPLAAILDYIKEAAQAEALPMKGSMNLQRTLLLAEPIGTNKTGEAAYSMVVITDQNGCIITAYPE